MASPVQVGDVVAGKYRVDAVIGHGGMGVVVSATDTILDRRVAVKFLLPQYAENPVASGRFLREARATARLNSPHTVRIIEVGQLPTGSPFMVMEFLEGVDLGTLLERQGALDVRVAVDYVVQAARGLGEAHQAGIVHRDVKPTNLFLSYQASSRPIVKVLDFGVSKLNLGLDGVGSLTTTGQTLGSPLYMAPEQMRSSQTADARSDVWGLGVVLFELLTGARPFMADSLAELVLVITQDAPLDPQRLRPDLPRGLSEIVLRCLEKDPNRRYATVAELARELSPFGWAEGGDAPAVRVAPPTGEHGTLVIAADHPGVARLAQMAEAVLGPSAGSAHPSVAPPAAPAPPPVGSKSSSPWSSTNDDPRPERPRKGRAALLWGALATAAVLLAGALFFVLERSPENGGETALESAASALAGVDAERSRGEGPVAEPAAADPPPEGGKSTASGGPDGATSAPSVPPSAPQISLTIPSVEATPSSAPESSGEAPMKKVNRRPPPERPKSAKERLGF